MNANDVITMRPDTAEQLESRGGTSTTLSQPDPEPADLASCLSGPSGHDLVVELAHDLRSPLTTILFLAEAMQAGHGGPVTDIQRRQLGLMYNAALCLCGTASDVLEMASGGYRLTDRQPAPFSVVDVFTSVRSMILPLAEEKGLDVRLIHPVSELRVGHARALSRVILNLAMNAAKFTHTGYVEIAAQPSSPTRLEFSVRDTGDGIDPAALRKLYQPFRKTRSEARHHFSSAGLGLAICRKLVRALESHLHVETRPHGGTRFWFDVDVPPAAAAA